MERITHLWVSLSDGRQVGVIKIEKYTEASQMGSTEGEPILTTVTYLAEDGSHLLPPPITA